MKASRRFQPGEGPSRGLLRDCEIFGNIRITFVSSTNCYPLLFSDEVARLLRDHQQNRELLRRLGKRYYQVVYPIQVLFSSPLNQWQFCQTKWKVATNIALLPYCKIAFNESSDRQQQNICFNHHINLPILLQWSDEVLIYLDLSQC